MNAPISAMFKGYWRMLRVMVPVGAVVGLIIAAVVTCLMPKVYVSLAVMEIRHLDPVAPGTLNPDGIVAQAIVRDEFVNIKSRKNLLQVITALDLLDLWSMDEESALRELGEIVELRTIRESDLVSISVKHTDKFIARDIVNEVIRGYREHREIVAGGLKDKAILELTKTIREQEAKVENSEDVLASMKSVSRNEDFNGTEDPKPVNAKLLFLEGQIEFLKKYEGEKFLIVASGLDLLDNVIQKLHLRYLEFGREIENLKANGFADDDPLILSKVKRHALMKTELDEAALNLLIRLEGQLETAREPLVGTFMKDLDPEKKAVGGSIEPLAFFEAKREYETDLNLLESLKGRLGWEIESREVYDELNIHDEPIVPESPVSPELLLNLLIGFLGGVLLSPFLAFLQAWRMNRNHAA